MGKAPLINENSKIEYSHRLSGVAGSVSQQFTVAPIKNLEDQPAFFVLRAIWTIPASGHGGGDFPCGA
jgi:hypothetical protein